jgi:hypothetical protein
MSLLLIFTNVCHAIHQDTCKAKEQIVNLKRNRLQARKGVGAHRASCSLQQGIKWHAWFIVCRGWGGTLAGNHNFSVKLEERLTLFLLTMDL